ncbi:MAG TPA: aminotransferase class IV, partial [Steroidobacteraceae bacterium]|nr:aminotransferase class IV [Steroidobacteraceae bacterium]
MTQSQVQRPAFGTVFTDHMAMATFSGGQWRDGEIRPTAPISLHPAAHVLHYASTCFEGFKAYLWNDGSINVFRMDRHIERMRQSARGLRLPEPDPEPLAAMVRAVVDRCRNQVPEAPGALYLRPLLFGTLENLGAAAAPSREATLLVLASPVWDSFAV